MMMTNAMREAMQATVDELTPAAETMNRLAAEYNLRFMVNGAQVNIGWWNDDNVSALSHVEFREIATLSEEALHGIIRSYHTMIVKTHQRGKQIGRDETKNSLKELLGLN